jgi:hypothetical protein
MPDSVTMWKTGSSVLDAEQAGKWRSQSAVKPARFAKVAELAGLQLSTRKRASAFPGTGISLKTGSPQLTKTVRSTYLAFGHAKTQIA